MKKLFKIILITFIIGNIFTFVFIGNDYYNTLIKPELSPPGFIFPIVWSILFILMSISLYLLDNKMEEGYPIYFTQLIVNSLWTLIAFGLKLRLLAALWIVLLIILVLIMIIKFYKINKKSGLLNIPYLLWLIFALYLSIMIFYLN